LCKHLGRDQSTSRLHDHLFTFRSAHHPISHTSKLTKLFLQHNTPPIKRPKVKIKRIHHPLALIHHHNHTGFLISRAAICSYVLALQPLRIRGDVVVASEVDVFAANNVELVEVFEREWRVRNVDAFEGGFGVRVGELSGYGGGAVGIGGVEVEEWGWWLLVYRALCGWTFGA
jgi:hypothetical protein